MKYVIFVVLLVITCVSSFIFGARFGAQQFLLQSSSGWAMQKAIELEYLNAGRVNKLKSLFEIQLDQHISNYGRLLDSQYPVLIESHTAQEEHAKYIIKAIDYRLANPFNKPEINLKQFPKTMKTQALENEFYFNRALQSVKQNSSR